MRVVYSKGRRTANHYQPLENRQRHFIGLLQIYSFLKTKQDRVSKVLDTSGEAARRPVVPSSYYGSAENSCSSGGHLVVYFKFECLIFI